MIVPDDDYASLALLFHLNSEPRNPRSRSLIEEPDSLYGDPKRPEELVLAPLPEQFDSAAERAIYALVRERASCRRFDDQEISLSTLLSVLTIAYGVVGLRRRPNGLKVLPRPVPSAGGFYDLTLHVHARNVNGIGEGLYTFQATTGELVLRLACAREVVEDCVIQTECVRNANAIVVISTRLGRVLRNYGARGYRYALLEAGHTGQNITLAAAAHGLSSVCIGGFNDAKLNRAIGLDGRADASIYCVSVGLSRCG